MWYNAANIFEMAQKQQYLVCEKYSSRSQSFNVIFVIERNKTLLSSVGLFHTTYMSLWRYQWALFVFCCIKSLRRGRFRDLDPVVIKGRQNISCKSWYSLAALVLPGQKDRDVTFCQGGFEAILESLGLFSWFALLAIESLVTEGLFRESGARRATKVVS